MVGVALIEEVISNLERESGGQISFAFVSVDGALSHRGDEVVATASTYKLPLLIHLASLVHEGKLSWNLPLRLTDALKSRGTGVLRSLTSGLELPLSDVCHLMTVLSDNTATDMLVDRFGLEGVNAWLRSLGLERTTLLRQDSSSDGSSRAPFATGITTPNEIAQLLQRLASGSFGPGVTRDVLEMLAAQNDQSMIPRYLPPGWSYAGKTGSNDDLRADVGLVRDPAGRGFALALFCKFPTSNDWSLENPGTLALARLAKHLLLDRASKT
jgi:beta-lactamase class A